ncbi:MAG: Ras family protein [Candidatus Improbicoccus devescovinae]|nr:MAG: Ras family protein [Candidatus Improbicoccus devescovinae]
MFKLSKLLVVLFSCFIFGYSKIQAHVKYVKIVVVGDKTEGKTAIIERLKNDNFVCEDPTDDFSFYQEGYKDYSLKVYDTPGWKYYFEKVAELLPGTHITLIVVDMTLPCGDTRREYINRIFSKAFAQTRGCNGTIMFVGAKCDQRTNLIVNYTETFNFIKDISREIGSKFIISSAYLGTFDVYSPNGTLERSGRRDLVWETFVEVAPSSHLYDYDKNLSDQQFVGSLERARLEKARDEANERARIARREADAKLCNVA